MNDLTHIGKYQVTRVIGQGGMGVVYQCFDSTLNRVIAVKVLAPNQVESTEAMNRILIEARAAAALQHPNVVQILDGGEHEGQFFFAMEHIDGSDLATVLKNHARMSPSEVARIIGQVAAALDAAHEKGILHRDVKPANILIAANGSVKLADFGIARLSGDSGVTRTGVIIGTPAYMAPELWKGSPASAATDVYALAAVAFELLDGTPPFQADSVIATGWKHVNEPIPVPKCNPGKDSTRLKSVIRRGLAKVPSDRFSSAGEFAAALKLATTPDEAGVGYKSRRIFGIATLGMALAGCLIWALNSRGSSDSISWAELEVAEPRAENALNMLLRADASSSESYWKQYRPYHESLTAAAKELKHANTRYGDSEKSQKYSALGNFYDGYERMQRLAPVFLNVEKAKGEGPSEFNALQDEAVSHLLSASNAYTQFLEIIPIQHLKVEHFAHIVQFAIQMPQSFERVFGAQSSIRIEPLIAAIETVSRHDAEKAEQTFAKFSEWTRDLVSEEIVSKPDAEKLIIQAGKILSVDDDSVSKAVREVREGGRS